MSLFVFVFRASEWRALPVWSHLHLGAFGKTLVEGAFPVELDLGFPDQQLPLDLDCLRMMMRLAIVQGFLRFVAPRMVVSWGCRLCRDVRTNHC